MTTIEKRFLATLLVLVCAPAVHGQGAVPVGDELQMNSYTLEGQYYPSVATLAGGGLVAVWESYGSSGSDSSGASIQGQRYAAGGTPLGGEFQVNSETAANQLRPSVSALTDGGFVVAWHSSGSSGSESSGFGIHGQRYAADGTPLGGELQVDSTTAATGQLRPSAAALAGGGFVVAWHSSGSSGPDSSGFSVQGRRYATDGTPLGGKFQINSTTDGDQFDSSLAALAEGGFVALWTSNGSSGSDSSGASIQGQRYAADGTVLGGEFQVNSHTAGDQRSPSVATLADGGFIAVWESYGSSSSDSSGASIQGQRYSADGVVLGGEFQINSTTAGDQRSPSVAAVAGGGFMTVWHSYGSSGSDSSGTSIQGQRYAADGMALGGEHQVNSTTASYQWAASVAAVADGGFVVAWTSDGSSGSDSSGISIQGQRFAAPRFSLVGHAGKCLDVQGEDTADGTPVNLFRCHGGENQTWRLNLTSVPQKVVGIGGKCLIPEFDHPSGTNRVVIGECGPDRDVPLAPFQGDLWQLVTTGHARPSALIHAETGLCLDVEGAVPDDGTPTRLFECHGGAHQVWRPAAEVCTRDSRGLCLNQDRFRVDLEWRSFDDTTGSGRAVPVGTDNSGLLWFFEADNWELLIKVLDGCAFNDRSWVFAAATTTVEYTLTVTDTQAGAIREYFNPLGTAAAAITDTGAFAACLAPSAPASFAERSAPERISFDADTVFPAPGVSLKGSCVPSLTRMCLSDNRFSVEATWHDYAGNTGSAQVVPAGTPDSGLFWFFDPGNWELLVKVLDACDINGQFLFLGAASTDVEYTVRVTDMDTGVFWEHTNPLGQASNALVHWFETCS